MKPPKKLKRDVEQYAQMLAATGMDDREVMRAALFANEYGLKALSGPGCVTFDEPSCGSWNCIRPDHQRVSK